MSGSSLHTIHMGCIRPSDKRPVRSPISAASGCRYGWAPHMPPLAEASAAGVTSVNCLSARGRRRPDQGPGPSHGNTDTTNVESRIAARPAAHVPRRRRPNPAERRRELCDSAIQLLAVGGAKGLSHLKVDRKAGVADGTTSFYFRTRSALLRGVAERLAELDLANLQLVADSAAAQPSSPSQLSVMVIQSGSEPQLSLTKARYELAMQATRDPELAAILQQSTDAFTKLHRDILVRLMPRGGELEPSVIEDLSNITLTFINGLLLRFAHGDRIITSPEQLDAILSALAGGILKSSKKGRLTDATGKRALLDRSPPEDSERNARRVP